MPRRVASVVLLSILSLPPPPSFGQDPPPNLATKGDPSAPPIPTRSPDDAEEKKTLAELAKLFAPPSGSELDQIQDDGLPNDSRPEILTWELVYRLALIHSHATPPPRFERLDPAQIAQEAQKLKVGDFEHFRTHCLPARDFRDPATDFLNLQAQLRAVAEARATSIYYDRWLQIFEELMKVETPIISQIDVDQTRLAINNANREYMTAISLYRDRLDQFKLSLGLSPRAVFVLDEVPLARFSAAFGQIGGWFLQPQKNFAELEKVIFHIPPLGLCAVDGHAVLDEVVTDPSRLEEVLARVAQFALDHRREPKEDADAVELRVRQRFRRLLMLQLSYSYDAQTLALAMTQHDAIQEQIIAPPTVPPTPRVTASLVTRLLDLSKQVSDVRTRIVRTWTLFQSERLAFDRDLGQIDDREWPEYLKRFATLPAEVPPPPIAVPAENPPMPVRR